MAAHGRPVLRELRLDEWPQEQRWDDPAYGRDRHRWYMAGGGSAGDVIAGPAQGGEGRQQIGRPIG